MEWKTVKNCGKVKEGFKKIQLNEGKNKMQTCCGVFLIATVVL